MNDGLDPTTIVFAVVAFFVVWKLRSVLGSRVDIDKPVKPNGAPLPPEQMGSIIRLPGAEDRAATNAQRDSRRFDTITNVEKARAGLVSIAAADPSFDITRFLNGAKIAYEMIIGAFATGDKKTLTDLLSPEVFASFVSVIDERNAIGAQATTKLVSIESVDIVDAGMKDSVAQISLRILAKMINAIHDSAGAVTSGDPETIVASDDLWTFARPIGSRDPTWRLIATESEH